MIVQELVMKVNRSSLVEQVAEALRARLASREEGWRLGDRVPPEHRLSLELGVGRSTIREAIRTLTSEGWLEPRQGAGTYVRRDVEAPPGLLSTLRRAELAEVFEARHGVEVEAARLAAMRRTDDDIAAIESALRRRRDNERRGRPRAFVAADIDFHRAVVRAAQNAILLDVFESLSTVIADSLLALRSHDLGSTEASEAHSALADAIRNGDAEGAARLARAQFQPAERMLRERSHT